MCGLSVVLGKHVDVLDSFIHCCGDELGLVGRPWCEGSGCCKMTWSGVV